MSYGGKGSRPRKVDQKKFSDNWDRIFGKKNDFSNATKGPVIVDDKSESEVKGSKQ